MKFIAHKTDDGRNKGKISFYCEALGVSRQGFYKYLENRDKPWKYEALSEKMTEIVSEDACNDTYGKVRMRDALLLKKEQESEKMEGIEIPGERTVYRIMERIGIAHHSKHKPNSITKEDREAQKSDDKLKRDFSAEAPDTKAVTDITEVKGKDGKLYVSAVFDCFDLMVLGLAMDTNMKAELCARTMKNACELHAGFRGAIVHSDRGKQYTSELYRDVLSKYGITQSMNSAGGRCHDNARCESIWARLKEELFYHRGRQTEHYKIEELKFMVWRYFMSYWSNRRICSAIGGIPPAVKRRRFYSALTIAA